MTDTPDAKKMVGLFWVVEDAGRPAVLAHAVPLEQAEPYGEVLTVSEGHFEFWSGLARRGAGTLRRAGLPHAPLWSEYEEWPRGRVLYNLSEQRFVIRTDRQLHRPAFVRLISNRFGLSTLNLLVLADDHYRSVRTVPIPAG